MTAPTYSAPNTILADLPIDDVYPSPLNPRTHFDPEALAELAESIRQHGVMQPILVRPAVGIVLDEDTTADGYLIVAGERRWRASKLAGQETIPAVIREDLDDNDHIRLALIENLQRRDLDPIEEAEGYRQLNRVVGLKQAAIAEAVNRSQPAVANAMRLLELPEDVQEKIRRRELSVSHGIALCRYAAFPELVSQLATWAVEKDLTSKDLDGRVLQQHSYELERLNLVQVLRGHETRFDRAVCASCPFGAYRKADYGEGLCLKPAHYRELNAAAEAVARAELDAKIAEAAVTGKPVLRVKDLAYDSFHDLSYVTPPSGCSSACPCRTTAIGRNEQPCRICTDPKRFRQLEAADTKAKEAGQRAEHKGKVAELVTRVDAIGEVGARELALICGIAMGWISRHSAGTETASRLGLTDRLPGLKFQRSQVRDEGLALFAALDPLDLVKLTVETLLRDDLLNQYDGYGGTAIRADWYLAGGEAPAEPAPPADAQPCENCGAPRAAGDILCGACREEWGDEWELPATAAPPAVVDGPAADPEYQAWKRGEAAAG